MTTICQQLHVSNVAMLSVYEIYHPSEPIWQQWQHSLYGIAAYGESLIIHSIWGITKHKFLKAQYLVLCFFHTLVIIPKSSIPNPKPYSFCVTLVLPLHIQKPTNFIVSYQDTNGQWPSCLQCFLLCFPYFSHPNLPFPTAYCCLDNPLHVQPST